MVLYFAVIFITTFLAWLYQHIEKKCKKFIYIFMVIFPTFFSGLRIVGTDYFVYKERYNYVIDGIEKDMIGTSLTTPFYKFMKLNDILGGSYQSFIFIVSLITIAIAFYIICCNENNIDISIAVLSYMTLYFLMSFNLFRQILASEIFLLAFYQYSKHHNKIKYLTLCIIATMIHSSIIIYIVLGLLATHVKERKKKRIRIQIYLISILIVFCIPMVSNILMKMSELFPHYSYYFMQFYYHGLGIGILRYIVLVVLVIVMDFYVSQYVYKEDDELYVEYSFIAMIGFILWMTSYISDTAIYRIGYIGLITMPLLHGRLICNLRKNIKIIIKLFLIIALVFFCWYDFYFLHSGDILPYKNIFSKI